MTQSIYINIDAHTDEKCQEASDLISLAVSQERTSRWQSHKASLPYASTVSLMWWKSGGICGG